MTSSNGNIFRVTGPLCEEFTVTGVTRSFDVFFKSWITGRVNNGEIGDLRRHRGLYDVIVMHNKQAWVHKKTNFQS